MELEQALEQSIEQFSDQALEAAILFVLFVFLMIIYDLSRDSYDQEILSSDFSTLEKFFSYIYQSEGDLADFAKSQQDPITWALNVLKKERQRQEVESYADYQKRLLRLKELADFINQRRNNLSDAGLEVFNDFLDQLDLDFPTE